MFNEKLSVFLEKHKDITLLSFAWSMYWRIAVLLFVVFFIVSLISNFEN